MLTLGHSLSREGLFAEARDAYEQALRLFRASGSRNGQANALRSLGDLDMRTADRSKAESALQEADKIFLEIGDLGGRANVQKTLGDLYAHENRLRPAEQAYELALHSYKTCGVILGQANALRALGDILVHTKRERKAEQLYSQALELYREIPDVVGQSNALSSLGHLQLRWGNPRRATGLLRESLVASQKINFEHGVIVANSYLAEAALETKRPLVAAVLAGRAVIPLCDRGDHWNVLSTLPVLLRALGILGDYDAVVAGGMLMWWHGTVVGHPSAENYERLLEERGLQRPSTDDVEGSEALVFQAIEECEQRLIVSGEDPYGDP